jgi:NAD(P)-dependent dehydrogenase (short-subunit alcohol dehydrogenase family)
MSKTILITGTSQGIGHALTKLLLINGYRVIGTNTTGIDNINENNYKSFSLNLANFDSIAAFENNFQLDNIKIDILINNAGIGPDLDFDLPEETSFKKTFDVNVTGTTFFTEQMLQYLNIGGKIVNISSKMGSVDVCEKSDSVAYRMSKAALNMYTKILSNRLEGKQLVASVHPGWVRTNIAKSNVNGRLSPEESAQKIFQFITSDFKTGIFWNVETEAECTW